MNLTQEARKSPSGSPWPVRRTDLRPDMTAEEVEEITGLTISALLQLTGENLLIVFRHAGPLPVFALLSCYWTDQVAEHFIGKFDAAQLREIINLTITEFTGLDAKHCGTFTDEQRVSVFLDALKTWTSNDGQFPIH